MNDDRDTVYVSDTPNRLFGNVLIDGPDGQCVYIYAGIGERCQNEAVAHTHIKRGGGEAVVEMCAEHAPEEVPEPPSTEQAELVPDGGRTDPPSFDMGRCKIDDCEWSTLTSAGVYDELREHLQTEHGYSDAEWRETRTELMEARR